MKTFKTYDEDRIDNICEGLYDDLEITEAEYQGRKVK